ncbi:uncharacterized protein EI97DRAFT_79869 [Westerdykella ornata]|uniref:Uncharacterized protein n=1 Tax=Westerdykella ornata TaxID=318751 RepID=A0A6A6JHT1_WESOR|nr:uncharacterized protein EI97DRAFT_79869 [Westerdykella ornata]KAF2275196.1 hypothetical protein EI97DRAFT_79869 [Westerdykella ornata]
MCDGTGSISLLQEISKSRQIQMRARSRNWVDGGSKAVAAGVDELGYGRACAEGQTRESRWAGGERPFYIAGLSQPQWPVRLWRPKIASPEGPSVTPLLPLEASFLPLTALTRHGPSPFAAPSNPLFLSARTETAAEGDMVMKQTMGFNNGRPPQLVYCVFYCRYALTLLAAQRENALGPAMRTRQKRTPRQSGSARAGAPVLLPFCVVSDRSPPSASPSPCTVVSCKCCNRCKRRLFR